MDLTSELPVIKNHQQLDQNSKGLLKRLPMQNSNLPIKRPKMESKPVIPWEVMDLTDEGGSNSSTSLSASSSSQGIKHLHNGTLRVTQGNDGKMIEVVEVDDKDWKVYGELSSTIIGLFSFFF